MKNLIVILKNLYVYMEELILSVYIKKYKFLYKY